MKTITIEEFKSGYIERSGMSEQKFDDLFVVRPCSCSEEGCQGFAVVTNNELQIKIHKDLYEK